MGREASVRRRGSLSAGGREAGGREAAELRRRAEGGGGAGRSQTKEGPEV